MSLTTSLVRIFSAVLTLAAAALLPATATAQGVLSFFWGGGSRQEVPFSSRYSPRQIIVSFGDRKLLLGLQKGCRGELSDRCAAPEKQLVRRHVGFPETEKPRMDALRRPC